MNGKRLAWMTVLAATIVAAPAGRAQIADGAVDHASAVPTLSEPQLEQLAAPIALYPDDLIAWVLRAATHPLDVVEAHRWMQTEGSSLPSGDQLAAALQDKPWDASVKALVPIPHVIETMDADLGWTRQLGEVYRTQEPALMDAIQALRHRAEAAGTLQSTTEQQVVDDGRNVFIDPAYPDVLPVPYYDPNLAYGAWPWGDYPPMTFSPPFDLLDWGPTIVFQTVVVSDFDHDRRHRRHRNIDWRDRRVAPAAVPTAATAVAAAGAAVPTPGAVTPAAGSRQRWQPTPRQELVIRMPPVVRAPIAARIPEAPVRGRGPVMREPDTVVRVPRQSARAPEVMIRMPQPAARLPEPVLRAAAPAFHERRIEAPAFAAEPRHGSWHAADPATRGWRGR